MSQTDHILSTKFNLSVETIDNARQEALSKTEPFGACLLRRHILDESQLLEFFSTVFGLPVLTRLPLQSLDNAFTQKIPIHFLKKFVLLPLGPCRANGDALPPEDDNCLIVMADPTCIHALDDLVSLLGTESYQLAIAPRSQIINAINLAYDFNRNSAEQLVQDMEDGDLETLADIEVTADLLDETSEAPIIRLVNQVISQSAKPGPAIFTSNRAGNTSKFAIASTGFSMTC